MDSRLIRTRAMPKPLLLKDFLLDDLGSCSSNGFKSFPRRQCCTTVRFIHDFDLIKNKQQQKKYSNSSKPSSISALLAFQSVIAAVKRLPFAAAKSPENKIFQNSLLARSFSRKILKKSSFWKRKKSDGKEIGRWKSFDQLLKEDAEPSDRSYSSITTTDSKSNSCSGSDFTVSSDECSSGNSSAEVNLNLPEEEDVVKMTMEVVSDKGVGVTNGDVSTDSTTNSDDGIANNTNSSTNTKKQCTSDEKDQQFSPVSVLDCPFDDEDEVSSSPFQHRLARMEGAKKKLMKKIQRFECLAKLEPVNLSARFELQPDSDNESSSSIDDKFISDIEEEDDEAECKALELLHEIKATDLPSQGLKLNEEKLILDFFRERITDIKCANFVSSFEEELLEEAEDWINGRKLFLGWEVEKNRQAYIEDIEKRGEWIRKRLDQEIKEVALELENEVFDSMLNEVFAGYII